MLQKQPDQDCSGSPREPLHGACIPRRLPLRDAQSPRLKPKVGDTMARTSHTLRTKWPSEGFMAPILIGHMIIVIIMDDDSNNSGDNLNHNRIRYMPPILWFIWPSSTSQQLEVYVPPSTPTAPVLPKQPAAPKVPA